jgi:hypothetical protein
MDALTCALAALQLAGAGAPGHQLPVAVQDDALLLNLSPAQVQQYIGQIAQEGASYVRLTASWSGLAPSPQSTRKPGAPFDASEGRGARGPQAVHVERKDPGTGAWTPVSVTGSGCDQGTQFSTDAAGGFYRLSTYQGNATYRMTVRQPDGTWAPSAEVPVSR